MITENNVSYKVRDKILRRTTDELLSDQSIQVSVYDQVWAHVFTEVWITVSGQVREQIWDNLLEKYDL
jgi:hypothetical protein